MHSEVIPVLEGRLGVGRETEDLLADEEVSRLDVLSLEEVVKLWAVFGWSLGDKEVSDLSLVPSGCPRTYIVE